MLKLNDSILDLVNDVDFFDGFSHEEIQELMQAGEWLKAPQGKAIIREGDLDLHMFVIIQGTVRVSYNDKVLAELDAGDTFGEFGLMGGRRSADVVTTRDCLLMGFSADHMNLLSQPLQIKFLKKLLFSMFARLQKVNREVWWELPTLWR